MVTMNVFQTVNSTYYVIKKTVVNGCSKGILVLPETAYSYKLIIIS